MINSNKITKMLQNCNPYLQIIFLGRSIRLAVTTKDITTFIVTGEKK